MALSQPRIFLFSVIKFGEVDFVCSPDSPLFCSLSRINRQISKKLDHRDYIATANLLQPRHHCFAELTILADVTQSLCIAMCVHETIVLSLHSACTSFSFPSVSMLLPVKQSSAAVTNAISLREMHMNKWQEHNVFIAQIRFSKYQAFTEKKVSQVRLGLCMIISCLTRPSLFLSLWSRLNQILL